MLPGLLVFGLGLSMTVAPLTATVLADADDSNAGIASGVNNAIARVAGLVAIAAVGAVVAASFALEAGDEIGAAALRAAGGGATRCRRPKRQPLATVSGAGRAGGRGGVGARVGRGRVGGRVPRGPRDRRPRWWRSAGCWACSAITNPRRKVAAADCPGGQLVGQPREGARASRRATGATQAPAERRWALEAPDPGSGRASGRAAGSIGPWPSTGAPSSASARRARSSWRCRPSSPPRRRSPSAPPGRCAPPFAGPVLFPRTPGYNSERLVYNTRYDGVRPQAVVQPLDTRDVQAVVNWANRFGVRDRGALRRPQLRRLLDDSAAASSSTSRRLRGIRVAGRPRDRRRRARS